MLKTVTLLMLLFCVIIWQYTIRQFGKRLPERDQKKVRWVLSAIDIGVLILLSFLLAAVLIETFQWEFPAARYLSAGGFFILFLGLKRAGYLPFQ